MSRLAFSVLLLLVVAWRSPAHDGGFGHSRRTLFLTATPQGFVLEYRLQHNRDDAVVEMVRMDADRDGRITEEEKQHFLKERAGQLAAHLLAKTPAGTAVALTFDQGRFDQALTQTYRWQLTTTAVELLLDDRNFGHKPGLVLVRHGESVTVTLAQATDLTHAERVSLRVRRSPGK